MSPGDKEWGVTGLIPATEWVRLPFGPEGKPPNNMCVIRLDEDAVQKTVGA